jgi:hypothetical protein
MPVKPTQRRASSELTAGTGWSTSPMSPACSGASPSPRAIALEAGTSRATVPASREPQRRLGRIHEGRPRDIVDKPAVISHPDELPRPALEAPSASALGGMRELLGHRCSATTDTPASSIKPPRRW